VKFKVLNKKVLALAGLIFGLVCLNFSTFASYVLVQTIGDSLFYRTPIEMTLDEYLDYNFRQTQSEFWTKQQEDADAESKPFAPSIEVQGLKDIFGSNEIEIRPQGSAELSFGLNVSNTENPRIPERQRRITTFDFNQKIQLNVVGQIGTKLQLGTNYNTEATFDFENQMKLDYTGDEDEIIQKIEAGNVSLPLPGSLIQGSQSLFGLKLETKWGKLKNTTVLSFGLYRFRRKRRICFCWLYRRARFMEWWNNRKSARQRPE